jgi:putative sigma-54 modulation protein
MRVDITGRHIDITPGLRQLIGKSLARVERLLNERAVSATVVLTKEKYRHKTELVVHAKGDHILSGIGEGNTWPLSVRKAAAKIEHQAQKLKSRWTEGKRQRKNNRAVTVGVEPTPAPPPAAAPAGRAVRRTRYAVKPMSIDDAVQRLEAVPENFVLFRNAQSDAITLVFRRKDGNLGLIEPD